MFYFKKWYIVRKEIHCVDLLCFKKDFFLMEKKKCLKKLHKENTILTYFEWHLENKWLRMYVLWKKWISDVFFIYKILSQLSWANTLDAQLDNVGIEWLLWPPCLVLRQRPVNPYGIFCQGRAWIGSLYDYKSPVVCLIELHWSLPEQRQANGSCLGVWYAFAIIDLSLINFHFWGGIIHLYYLCLLFSWFVFQYLIEKEKIHIIHTDKLAVIMEN